MSNRMQEILGGILGMFGNNQEPRVIDKSQYMTAGQEYLYGDKQGTPINMTGVTTTPNFAQMSSNKGRMTDPQLQRMSNLIEPELGNTVREPYERNFPQGSPFDAQGRGISYGAMDTNLNDFKPTLTSDMIKSYSVKGQEGEMPFEESKPGLLDNIEKKASSLGDYLLSQKGIASMTMAFNNMRLQPSEAINTLMTNKIKKLDDRQDANKTAETFRKMALKETDPKKQKLLRDYADGLDKGIITDGSKAFSDIFKDPTSPFSINLGDNKKYADNIATSITDFQTKVQEQSTNARNLLDAYNRMQQVFEKIDWKTGLTEQFKQELRLATGGLPILSEFVDQTKLGAGEELKAIVNNLVAGELRKNKGPQTDFDAQFLEATMPNLGLTPEANKKMLNYNKSVSRIDLLIGQIMNQADMKDPDQALDVKRLAETLYNSARRVIKMPNGNYVTFEEWYHNPNQSSLNGLERLEEWANIGNQVLNVGVPKITLDAIKGKK